MHISYFGRLTKVHKFLSQSNQIRVIQFLELWISWIWDAQSSLCTHLANTKLNASKCGFIEKNFSDWAPATYLQLLLVIAFCECVCMHALWQNYVSNVTYCSIICFLYFNRNFCKLTNCLFFLSSCNLQCIFSMNRNLGAQMTLLFRITLAKFYVHLIWLVAHITKF